MSLSENALFENVVCNDAEITSFETLTQIDFKKLFRIYRINS